MSLASSDNAWVVLQTKQGVMQQRRRGNSITNDEEWIHKPEQKWGEADSKKLIASKKNFHPLIFKTQKRRKEADCETIFPCVVNYCLTHTNASTSLFDNASTVNA